MPKVLSMSSKALVKFLERGGAVFVRQGKTDHANIFKDDRRQKIFCSCPDGEEDIRSGLLQESSPLVEIHG